ncbi:MAG: hypothetical protein R3F17_05620 [Planctomycetota bacterium]
MLHLLLCALPGLLAPSPQGPCLGPDDGFEENDSCNSPSMLPGGTHLGLYVSPADPDFYTISIPALHSMQLTELSDSGDTRYVLLDPLNCSYPITPTQTDSLVFGNGFPNSPQTVLLQAVPFGACGVYDLDIQFVPDPCLSLTPDSMEPNDDCQSAQPLADGTTPGLVVHLENEDWYTTTAAPGEMVRLDLANADTLAIRASTWLSPCGGTPVHVGFESTWYTNLTSSPVELRFRVYQPVNGFLPSCTSYDAVLTRTPASCPGGGDGFEPNDSCSSPATLTTGTFTALTTSPLDEDWYSACVGAGDSFYMYFDVLGSPVEVDLFSEPGGPCGSAFLHQVVQDSWEIGPWSPSGSDFEIWIRVRGNAGAGIPCSEYHLSVGGVGNCTGLQVMPYCEPMDPNSTGQSTLLIGSHGSGVGSGLRVTALGGPPGEFAFLLVGTGASSPGTSMGGGRLCLRTAAPNLIGRYNIAGTAMNSLGQFDSTTYYQNLSTPSFPPNYFYVPDTLPLPGTPSIAAGQTWFFQLWHRDGSSSNFSNALAVTF